MKTCTLLVCHRVVVEKMMHAVDPAIKAKLPMICAANQTTDTGRARAIRRGAIPGEHARLDGTRKGE